jgi:hypothetical protein
MHHHTHVHHHNETDPEVLARLDAISTQLGLMETKIMAAIDDLKTAIAGLITEATTDVSTLIGQINTQTGNDPAVLALTAQVQQAITDLHTTFTGATGVPLPPPTPAPTPAPTT